MNIQKRKRGQPRKYPTAALLEKAINNYFDSISYWETVTDKEDQPILSKSGEEIQVLKYATIPSVLGLELYVGLTDMEYYVNNPILDEHGNIQEDFSPIIKMAKKRIEHYASEQLYREKGNVTGIIFYLKNNFGWTDKQEVHHTGEVQHKLQALTDEELESKHKQLQLARQRFIDAEATTISIE